MRHRNPTSGPRTVSLLSRRNFLAAACATGAALGALPGVPEAHADEPSRGPVPFRLSLSQRSLRQEMTAGRLDPLDFPRVARGLGLDAVEYVSTFYAAKLSKERE